MKPRTVADVLPPAPVGPQKAFTKADLATAVFGAWDGCISVLAALIAARHASLAALQAAGIGVAIGGTFSMATGQYEEMDRTETLWQRTIQFWRWTKTFYVDTHRMRLSIIMGVFTAIGGIVPVIAFLFAGKTISYVAAVIGSWLLATVVWVLKKEGLVGAMRTYALLIVTVAATVGVSIAFS